MKYKLSHKEVYVMQILWAAKEELSITDFIQRDPELSTSTVQVVLRSLLKKIVYKSCQYRTAQ
ncbi:MAG: BlaI/MecI/CopY family transcriptional regulator [Schaedlerella sp.]|nr:BlaI/MecI/CopY family transcriptional regulator [Lachnospiraceae bacterium]MDY4201904.1 BlaI/MecI/CopY family transcriptional regulator [Schaedlerella sp.]